MKNKLLRAISVAMVVCLVGTSADFATYSTEYNVDNEVAADVAVDEDFGVVVDDEIVVDSESIEDDEIVVDSESVVDDEVISDSESIEDVEVISDSDSIEEDEVISDSESIEDDEIISDSESIEDDEVVSGSKSVKDVEIIDDDVLTVVDFDAIDIEDNAVTIVDSNRPSLKELTKKMPKSLKATVSDGKNKKKAEVPVSWVCVGEDYENSEKFYYQFSPVIDKEGFEISDSLDTVSDAPYIPVFVELDEEMIEDAASNKEVVFNYLCGDFGLNSAAVCGIMANIQIESAFSPTIWGDNHSSYGLCQWHNERYYRMMDYCSNHGLDSNTVEGQVRFLAYELENYYPNTLSLIRDVADDSKGAYDAAYYFCVNYEVPADTESKARVRATLARDTFWPAYGGRKAFKAKCSVRYRAASGENSWGKPKEDGGAMAAGGSKPFTKIELELKDANVKGDIVYRANIVEYGWPDHTSKNGEPTRTFRKKNAIQEITINLEGEVADYFNVYYRVKVNKFGWLNWARNGERAGTNGYDYPIRAMQVVLKRKGDGAPGDVTGRVSKYAKADYDCTGAGVVYKMRKCVGGWNVGVRDGESTNANPGNVATNMYYTKLYSQKSNGEKLSGDLVSKCLCSKKAWTKKWKSSKTKMGYNKKNTQLRAVKFKLTGEMAQTYDVYYSVKCIGKGWTGWAKNGQLCGAKMLANSISAMRIKIVNKGAPAPGSTANRYFKK